VYLDLFIIFSGRCLQNYFVIYNNSSKKVNLTDVSECIIMLCSYYKINVNAHGHANQKVWGSNPRVGTYFKFCRIILYASNCIHSVSTAVHSVMNAIGQDRFIIGDNSGYANIIS
jgi:hypothetical protein